MRKTVLVKTYTALPDYHRKEILRYAGAREESVEVGTLLDECLAECDGVFTPKVCYLALTKAEFFTMFPPSETAKLWTEGCEQIVLFSATVGLGIDRLVNRYSTVSTAKALVLQAIGAERIERLCDLFCEEYVGEKQRFQKRFSPGYGDFPLAVQKEIFALLNPFKHIGVTLTDSLLMSPTKSVTAAFGIKNVLEEGENKQKNCESCNQKDCEFRRD